jgi:hypothetical protein
MSRNKYKKLKNMIHFQDNDLANKNKDNEGLKIRPHMKKMLHI